MFSSVCWLAGLVFVDVFGDWHMLEVALIEGVYILRDYCCYWEDFTADACMFG